MSSAIHTQIHSQSSNLFYVKSGDLVDGRYEILCEVASGGMATVYAARVVGAVGFEKLVALKRMLPKVSADERYRRMFLDEARVAAHIRSPYVVSTFDLGEQPDGSLYIVMDLVVGSALSSILAGSQGRQLPLGAVATIIEQSARGLHDAHIATNHLGEPLSIVHRDISPQNLLVGIDGASRITDFGVAHAAERQTKTVGFKVKGKLSYCSPEQARAHPLDHRSDVFALGIVMWESLVLRRLFQRSSPVETVRAHEQPIASPCSYRPEIPLELANVALRALQPDPAARFQTALEMAEAIRATGVGAPTADIKALVQEMAGGSVIKLTSSIKAAIASSTLRPSISPPSPLARPVAARTLATKTMMSLEAVGAHDIAQAASVAPVRERQRRASFPTMPAKRGAADTILDQPSQMRQTPQQMPGAPPQQYARPMQQSQVPGAAENNNSNNNNTGRSYRLIAMISGMLVLGVLLGGAGVYALLSSSQPTEATPGVVGGPNVPTPQGASVGGGSVPQNPVQVPGNLPVNPAQLPLPVNPVQTPPTVPDKPQARTPQPRANAGARGVGDAICDNTCQYANDNECDDGGAGSLYALCGLGSDCNDCGTRISCANTCQYANDGECDDGGNGSRHAVCAHGTDCGDCGPR